MSDEQTTIREIVVPEGATEVALPRQVVRGEKILIVNDGDRPIKVFGPRTGVARKLRSGKVVQE